MPRLLITAAAALALCLGAMATTVTITAGGVTVTDTADGGGDDILCLRAGASLRTLSEPVTSPRGRHGRAWPGHPRFLLGESGKSWMPRHESRA